MFKVAVLMPVYNGEKFLKKQIISILNQKKVDTTIFVSVDESTDDSLKIINNLKKKYKSINIFSKNIKFGSPTKNFFHLLSNFKIKDFDFISLSDQDDIWYPEKLLKSTDILKNKDYSIYSSSANAKIGSTRKYINKSGKMTKFDYYFESAGPGCTYVFDKIFFQNFQNYLKQNLNKLKDFDHYDWLIYAYARERNFSWYIDTVPSLDYVQHDNNFTGANVGLKSFFKRFKEVVSGEALEKANNLSKILRLKKIGIKDFKSSKSIIKLFFLSFSLRRSWPNKLLISIYFFLLIFIGKKVNGKKILSFQLLLNYLILIVFFLFFFRNFNTELLYTLSKNFNSSVYVFAASFFSLLIISFRIVATCNFFSYQKFNFFLWHKTFCESQIMSYLIPFSGIIYRGYLLNKFIKLTYFNYVKILIYLNILELFLISSSIFILIFYLNTNYQMLLYLCVFLIPCLYFILVKNFDLLSFDFFKRLKYFQKFSKGKINSLNSKQSLIIIFYTLLKIIFNYIIFLSIFFLIDINIDFIEILILTLINQIFEPLKITPQNIGITEAAFALFFSTLNNDPLTGSYVKIIHRSFEVINYFVYFISYKAITSLK